MKNWRLLLKTNNSRIIKNSGNGRPRAKIGINPCGHKKTGSVSIRKNRNDLIDYTFIKKSRLVSLYLIYSCAYYKFNYNLVTDSQFDALAKLLFSNRWRPEIKKHVHFHLIDWESLATSSTGYYVQYTAMIIGATEWAIDKHKKGELNET